MVYLTLFSLLELPLFFLFTVIHWVPNELVAGVFTPAPVSLYLGKLSFPLLSWSIHFTVLLCSTLSVLVLVVLLE